MLYKNLQIRGRFEGLIAALRVHAPFCGSKQIFAVQNLTNGGIRKVRNILYSEKILGPNFAQLIFGQSSLNLSLI